MKLLVFSDLHLEFAPFTPPPEAVDQADVVVLAGDIGIGVQGIRWAALNFGGKPIVYVAGNHEFYGGHWTGTLDKLRSAAADASIHFLENDAVELNGVRFLGATLWTDFAVYGDQEEGMKVFDREMEDAYQIAAGSVGMQRLTASDVLTRHRGTVAWLHHELECVVPTVVVTHHLPAQRSVADRFMGDPLTPCFASDLPNAFFQRAQVWVHGHTHDACDHPHFCCRLVCNPRGYLRRDGAFEGRGFQEGLLVAVPGSRSPIRI